MLSGADAGPLEAELYFLPIYWGLSQRNASPFKQRRSAMKAIFVAVIFAASTSMAFAQYGYGTGSNSRSTYVQPRINSNGTFTGGHYRTTPNNTQLDNYGTRGNYNPYTGRTGTRTPRY